MKHLVVRVVVAGGLFGLRWVAGTAQTARGDFERINAVAGTTNVECVRGCSLIESRDVLNPRAGQMRAYEFSCTSSTGRCAASVVGFLQR
jgi:hypothetical protein